MSDLGWVQGFALAVCFYVHSRTGLERDIDWMMLLIAAAMASYTFAASTRLWWDERKQLAQLRKAENEELSDAKRRLFGRWQG